MLCRKMQLFARKMVDGLLRAPYSSKAIAHRSCEYGKHSEQGTSLFCWRGNCDNGMYFGSHPAARSPLTIVPWEYVETSSSQQQLSISTVHLNQIARSCHCPAGRRGSTYQITLYTNVCSRSYLIQSLREHQVEAGIHLRACQ